MLERRAFEPEFLRRLDALVIATRRARTVRAGRRSIGRVQGAGIEPESYREYSEGDDLRFLDWNAFARLDDLTIRTFRAERQVETTIMIDTSASMAMPERDDKLGFALLLGAGLAYIAMSENDPVRLVAFSGNREIEVTPFRQRRESYFELRPFVAALRCAGETALDRAAAEVLRTRRQRGIVILISDFLVNAGAYEYAIGQLLSAHHEVKVIHVMGDQESTAAYPPGSYRIRDCETGEMRDVVFGPRETAACLRRVEQHSEQLNTFCSRRGVLYCRAFGASHANEIIASQFPRLGVIN